MLGNWSDEIGMLLAAAGCRSSLTRAGKAASAAGSLVRVVRRLTRRTMFRLGGCCVTPQITGCVRRSQRSLTRSAGG